MDDQGANGTVGNGRAKQTHQGRQTDKETNKLLSLQQFQLWQALREAKEELDALHATNVEAAVMMTQRLGFPVTKTNVRSAVYAGIVDWDHKKPASAIRQSLWRGRLSTQVKRLDDVVETLADHEARLLAMEDTLHRLCVALSVEYTRAARTKKVNADGQ